jgi:TGS domain.
MIKITLPDNSTVEVEKSTPAIEVAKQINRKLAEDALAVKINERVSDLTTQLESDCKVKFLTFDDPEGREVYWHSSSH